LGVPKKKTAVVLLLLLAAEVVLLTDAASIGDDGAKAVAVSESKAHNSARTSNDEAIIRSIVWALLLFCDCLTLRFRALGWTRWTTEIDQLCVIRVIIRTHF
jgi:hypothetical protein